MSLPCRFRDESCTHLSALRCRPFKRNFSDHCGAVCPGSDCGPDKIAPGGTGYSLFALRAAYFKLHLLYDACPAVRGGQLATNFAATTLRLGNGRRDRRDVVWKSTLV